MENPPLSINTMNVQDLGAIIAKEAEEGDVATQRSAHRVPMNVPVLAPPRRPAKIHRKTKVVPFWQRQLSTTTPAETADSQAPVIQDTTADSSFSLEKFEENIFGKASSHTKTGRSPAHKLPGINVWG